MEPDLVASVKFDDRGLVPVVVQQAGSGEVLMLAYMNRVALEQTIATGRATYWSRSRADIWVKGATSGHTQDVVSLALDCDRDTLLLTVNQLGPACHTGQRTCFHQTAAEASRA